MVRAGAQTGARCWAITEDGDEALGRIYWYGGEATWLAGLAIAIHRARKRAGDRGDLGPPA